MPNAELNHAFGTSRADSLAKGHSVTLIAEQTNGGLSAAAVNLFQPLIGPIEAVAEDGRRLRCLGVDVILETNAPVLAKDGSTFSVQAGLWVAISGAWRGSTVVASRIDLVEEHRLMAIAGVVRRDRESETLRIGALELVLPSATRRPQPGSFATMLGQRSGEVFATERMVPGRFAGLRTPGPLVRLSVEGYLETAERAPGYRISGLGHSFDEEAQVAALASSRALFVGAYDQAFRVEYGLPLPEDVNARGTSLASLDSGFAPRNAILTR